MSTLLKRDAGIPLYQQLADKIKDQIAAGELKENEQLMTEMELSKAYNISRITVRKALELLVDEEILTKRQGIGAFVTGKKLLRSMNTMMSFTQTCEMNGQKATSRLYLLDCPKHVRGTSGCSVSRKGTASSVCGVFVFATMCR